MWQEAVPEVIQRRRLFPVEINRGYKEHISGNVITADKVLTVFHDWLVMPPPNIECLDCQGLVSGC